MADVYQELQVELGKERMGRALDGIEEAQNTLDAALADLSTIIGGDRLWTKGGKLHGEIKAYWYAVNDLYQQLSRRGGPKVDEVTLEAEKSQRAAQPVES